MKKILKTATLLLLTLCILVPVFAVPAAAEKNESEIVKAVLRSQVLFDDLAKLTGAVKTNDAGKIFMCVLEIYPDLIAAIKKAMGEDAPPEESSGSAMTASIISAGDITLLFILTAAGSAALAVAVTYFIMKKKWKSAAAVPEVKTE